MFCESFSKMGNYFWKTGHYLICLSSKCGSISLALNVGFSAAFSQVLLALLWQAWF